MPSPSRRRRHAPVGGPAVSLCKTGGFMCFCGWSCGAGYSRMNSAALALRRRSKVI
eukprot:CAMPEP_0205958106 /NCGR_PEP_ID=MMETSP1459-20131121/47936_1 /ASSEMBLY_ACC=CAM_ASM_001120 /TAXON_ID=41880 /ORGANISM="Pycnococcus provasolii, Strain RCC931" /LENGTH=55 /DNA_ID=CAMNT_0053330625 /DNA_START=292 /DNA_END=459 /DNA_ORIENTATION=+